MPALSRAVATTGPAIPPPMTSAVLTLDVVAVDMGFSPARGVRRSFLCRDHAREPSYPLAATSWPGWSRAGIGSGALEGDSCEQPPRAPAAVWARRPGAIESPLVACQAPLREFDQLRGHLAAVVEGPPRREIGAASRGQLLHY